MHNKFGKLACTHAKLLVWKTVILLMKCKLEFALSLQK